ncbi:MAG: adenylyl-sulfate kinase [Ruminococcaceae bacterium]|nr:adenylyl-sulfate kinase [Oscillospiraceae bacterium]
MIQSILECNRRLAEDPAGFVAEAEANYDRQLTEIADYIAAHRDACPIVLLSGPSGSGKTTTALMLEHKLDNRGMETHTLSQDNYFRTLSDNDKRLLEQGELDLESPARVDEELLNQQLNDIIAGKPVGLTEFDFPTHTRRSSGKTLTRKPGEVVILEGIHTLNPHVVQLPESQTVRLYVSVRTRVEGPNGAQLHPKYVRLLRRMLRDVQHRGRHPEDTLKMFHSVNLGEDKFIMPYKHRSTFDVDTFFAYEMNVYRPYLLDQLQGLADKPEIAEILPILSAAEGLDASAVPETALIREFIGDSFFHK